MKLFHELTIHLSSKLPTTVSGNVHDISLKFGQAVRHELI